MGREGGKEGRIQLLIYDDKTHSISNMFHIQRVDPTAAALRCIHMGEAAVYALQFRHPTVDDVL